MTRRGVVYLGRGLQKAATVRAPTFPFTHLSLLYFQFLKYKATTNAGAATQRHLVNRGSLGLVPARTHVVLVATTRCASDNNGE